MSLIYIDTTIKHFIESIKTRYSDIKEQEFEIRLSENDTHSISKELFERLLDRCIKKYKIPLPITFAKSTITVYSVKNGSLTTEYRKIETDKETICQIKGGNEKFDRSYASKNGSGTFKLRYSSSREQGINCPENKGTVKITRRRKRFEYDALKGFTYMFTQIKENKSDDVKYEFEIEYDIKRVTPELILESLQILADRFKTNLSLEVTNDVKSKLKKDFIEPKPVNITENAYAVFKKYPYQVTNKLDGERFLLYFLNDCIYAIQHDKIFYIATCPAVFNNSIVDTEFFKGKYYFFDCYLFQSQKVFTNALTRRLEYAKQLATVNTAFVMKTFYINLLEDTSRLLETLDKADNDGLIYTPEDPNLRLSVYKWKYPEKMSIDFRVIETDTGKYDLCVYTSKDKKGETKFGEYVSTTPLKNGGIYEFVYQHDKFVLLRPRNDKVLPNFIDIATNVWNDIIHPFESFRLLEMFRPLHKFRKYHNRIKRGMITQYCKDKIVLDLGIGRGGDIDKYVVAKTTKVIGVEPYETNYTQLLKRLADSATVPESFVKLITTTAQNTQKIVTEVGVDGVDVVASFFSLSFFFFPGKPNDLLQLVQTISQNLKEGGYFIGTTIDGQKTSDLLQPLPDKTFNFGDGFIRLNADNTITFEVKGSIVETQQESLVNFDELTTQLAMVGIILVDTSFFENDKSLMPDENKLNGLYRRFVFRKHTMTESVQSLCTKKSIVDLLTHMEDKQCIDLFKKMVGSKVDFFEIPPEHIYDALQEFYITKKYINPIDSFNLIKTLSITGEDRLHKVVIREKIPTTAVLLKNYKKKENYPILREQLLQTIAQLQKQQIDYGSLTLDGLMVNEEKDGMIRLLFYDYSHMKKGEIGTDHQNIVDILKFI